MRLRSLFIAAIITSGLLPAAAGPARAEMRLADTTARTKIDWPQFRFDSDHTGLQPFEKMLSKKNIGSVELSWQAAVGGLIFYSSPAVANGTAYIGSSDGYLFAYPADGCGQSVCTTPLWSSTYLAQIMDSPTVADGIVYVGSQTDFNSAAGKLNAFSADGCGSSQCAPLWQGDAGDQSILESSPTVADGLVYVGAVDGKIYAFNAGGCGQALCEPVWTAQTGGSIESTPTIHGGVLFIASDDGSLYAFRAKGCGKKKSCKPLWTADIGGPAFGTSAAASNGVVYIASQHVFSAFAVDGCGAKSCAPLWQANENDLFYNGSPAIAHGRVYMPLEYSIVVYSAKGCGQQICAPLWTLSAGGAQADIESSPTIANGVVYAGRDTGELLAWADPCKQAQCFQVLSRTTPNPILNSSPTVVNGKIYIGGSDQEDNGWLYVYGLPK